MSCGDRTNRLDYSLKAPLVRTLYEENGLIQVMMDIIFKIERGLV